VPEWTFITSILTIILYDLVLSGDNAVVIGLAARGLESGQRQRAILIGGGLAVLLRLALTLPAEALLHVAYLRAGGGLLLTWVAYRLLADEAETADQDGGTTVASAIRLIVLADLTMSLDNVLAVAAVADRSEHSFLVLTVGLGLSIPVVLLGGGVVATLMRRLPWLAWVGAAVLTYTAADLMLGDEVVKRLTTPPTPVRVATGVIWTVLVLGVAWWTIRQRRAARSIKVATPDA